MGETGPVYRERGIVLVICLLLILAGTIVAIGGMTVSEVDMMISGNQRSLQQVFDASEAGIETGIGAFFSTARPWGTARPPITVPPSIPPWGIAYTHGLPNGCQFTLWITDMHVSRPVGPGSDPTRYRRFYYRISSMGRETASGPEESQGTRETDRVVSVVYRIR
ncbi:MAG: hypothetical protein JRH07_06790 [Deltaproteobacteria bacterium]|nr:hypothetical protein [Deltaproteobacteria bacterium]